MKILYDTNVILDILLERQPFLEKSTEVVGYAESAKISAYLCATTVATINYFVERKHGKEKARDAIKHLLTIFSTAQVTHSVLTSAAYTSIDDFEDAVIDEAAIRIGADAIVTRNVRDFVNASVPAYTPDELLSLLRSPNR